MIDAPLRLRHAIISANLLFVRRILKNNPTALSTSDHLGNTSLHLAASQGHLDIVQYFVDELLHEVDGISRNNLGDTPLIVAAAAGHEDVVRYLAERFGEEGVDCGNWLGVTPLMAASREGREGCVLTLLSLSADAEIGDISGSRAIHFAAAYGHLKIIRLLIERGVDTDTVNGLYFPPLAYSCTFEAEQYFSELVAERQARLNAIEKEREKRAGMVTAKNTQVNVTVADVDGVMGMAQVNQTAVGQALVQGLQQQQVAVRTV